MFRADGGRVGAVALEKSRHASIRIPARSSGLAPFVPTAGRFQAGKVRFGTRRFRHSPAVAGIVPRSRGSALWFRRSLPRWIRACSEAEGALTKVRISEASSLREGLGWFGNFTEDVVTECQAVPELRRVGRDLNSANIRFDEFQITLLAQLQFRVQLDRLVHFA